MLKSLLSAHTQNSPANSKGLAKLVNTVAETLLRAQMFPSLATQETLSRIQVLRP